MHVGIAYLRWRGNRSQHSRRMRTRDFAYLARGPCPCYFSPRANRWYPGGRLYPGCADRPLLATLSQHRAALCGVPIQPSSTRNIGMQVCGIVFVLVEHHCIVFIRAISERHTDINAANMNRYSVTGILCQCNIVVEIPEANQYSGKWSFVIMTDMHTNHICRCDLFLETPTSLHTSIF